MKFCMNCMEQYGDKYAICPVCGFTEGTMPHDSRCLTPGTILADRYITGMPIQIDDWLVKYIGWDALNERKVSIYEYFPVFYALRKVHEQRITIIKHKPYYKYLELLKNQAKLLSAFHMPENISAVYDTFEKNDTLYVTTDYHRGTMLDKYITEQTPLPYETVEKMLMPLLRSLDELHENGYVVGGFSPDAILITSERKLILFSYLNNIFFNISEEETEAEHSPMQDYFPYERLRSHDTDGLLPANDVYSAAMIFYHMLGAEVPNSLERIAYYQKSGKDRLKKLRSYHIRLDKNRETALQNALFLDIAKRTPDMETFMKELTSEKDVILRTKRNKKVPLFVKIGVPVAIVSVIAVIVVAVILPRMAKIGQTIVPDVLHNTVAEAEETLQKASLLMEIEGKEIADDFDEEIVLAQNVDAGMTVNENTAVGVTLSMHSATIVMPNLLGMRIDSCESVLKKSGISYTVESEYSDTVAKKCVIRQSIEPYTEIDTSTVVEIVISEGSEPSAGGIDSSDDDSNQMVTVENLTGQNYDTIAPRNNGSNSGTSTASGGTSSPVGVQKRVYDPSQPEGTIIGQEPEEGTEQSASEPVMLIVTTQERSQIMPDVMLLEQEEAVMYLQQCGLTAEIHQEDSEQVKEGLVMEQQPPAGTEVFADTPVTLTVSAGKSGVEMPVLVGMTKREAVKLLRKLKIPAQFTYRTYADVAEDKVIKQDIAPGVMVKQGTTALITLSTKEPVSEIPDLLGLDEMEAEQTLTSADLKMKLYQDAEFDSANDTAIISQYPDSGIFVKSGSTVLTVSGNPEKVPSIGSGLMIEPEEIQLKVGEKFVLRVEYPGIEQADRIEYEPEESNFIHYVTFKETDMQTLEMTIEGVSAGFEVITISYGKNIRTCKVTVMP